MLIYFNLNNSFVNTDICNYECEEEEKGLSIRVEIDQAHKIIHSRSYSDVLFSVAESYNWKIIKIYFIVL